MNEKNCLVLDREKHVIGTLGRVRVEVVKQFFMFPILELFHTRENNKVFRSLILRFNKLFIFYLNEVIQQWKEEIMCEKN